MTWKEFVKAIEKSNGVTDDTELPLVDLRDGRGWMSTNFGTVIMFKEIDGSR